MSYILTLIIVMGCTKISFENKNKNYEEVSLNINELVLSTIYNNDLILLDYYLSKLNNLDGSIGDRGTFLHVASEINNIDSVNNLLELGLDPLVKNSNGKYAYELSNNGDITKIIKEYIIRKEILIAANNREKDGIKILLSENKNILFLKVKNVSLLEGLCNILSWKKDKDIFNLIIDLLKDDFKKVIYLKKRIIEKGVDEVETREELNEYINILEGLKSIDNNYYPIRNFNNNYVKISLRNGYVSEFNRLAKLENRRNIVMALLGEFLENNNSFLENFSHNFTFINDIFKKLNLGDLLKKLDKKNNLKDRLWRFVAKNPKIDVSKINKFYNLFIKSMDFNFNKSINSLYIKGEEKEIKLFLTFHLTDLVLSPISLGYLFLYCLYKNYQDIVEYLVHKEFVINDTRVLDNYILEKDLIGKLLKKNLQKTIKKLLEVVSERLTKEELIVDYAFENFDESLIYLLKKRGNNFNNKKYLLSTIEKENLNILKLVLQDFKDIDYIDREHLLIKACKKANKEIMKLLLEKGANVNVKDISGYTALMLSSGDNNKEIVEMLIEKGANLNEAKVDRCTALFLSLQNKHREIAKLLIEKGSDINIRGSDSWTPLMLASKEGYKEVIELLIEKGVDINNRSNGGWTSLMLASKNGHKEIAELLIAKGADVNNKSEGGWNALMSASEKGHKEIVELLIEKGADINNRSNGGWTSLMEASKNGHKEIVELLIAKGAEISNKSEGGLSALRIASEYCHKEIVDLLLDRGANVNDRTNKGWTPLMTAAFLGHKEILNLLIEKGANINEQNNDSSTPLIIALEYVHAEIGQILIEKGADVNYKTSYGKTALMLSCKEGLLEIVDSLIKKGANLYTDNNSLFSILGDNLKFGKIEKNLAYLKIFNLLIKKIKDDSIKAFMILNKNKNSTLINEAKEYVNFYHLLLSLPEEVLIEILKNIN